jgi:outer membrane protein assembly factor BamE
LCSAIVLTTALGAGCSSNRWGFPYKVGVQQGNWITTEQVGLLYEGMTREQVRFALGSPTLSNVFHGNRWDYPYFYRSPNGEIEERKLTVVFQNGLLSKWSGDEQPTVQPFQIAEETVETSKEEIKKEELFRERSGVPATSETVAPAVDFSTVTDVPPSTDPGALPDAPDQTPVELM